MSANTTPDRDKLEIQTVMPGADVICAAGHQIALGFPEEVVKAWMARGAKVDAWIIPDVRTAHGLVQWALEFPLYYALFIQGTYGRGEKVKVVVRESDWPDVVEYLRLTLLGLTRDEMKHEGVSAEIVDMLGREIDHLALKKSDGTIAQIEDFLAPIFYDSEGMAELDGLKIRAHGDNTWSFFTEEDRIEEYQLEIPSAQLPVYADKIGAASAPMTPQAFEVVTLGASNGFDVGGPCSNILVQANGRFLLVDSGPYIEQTLRHSGVALNQLAALVITHAHEDHAAGLSALLALRHRLKLYITRENAAIMRRKLALLNPHLSSPATLLDDAFDLVLVEPGQPYAFLGLTLRFHYTFHSIPCTGVELSARDEGVTRRALIVGDNDCREHIEAAAEAGVISEERLEQLQALYGWQGDLLVADAGGGPIHGSTRDFEDNPSTHVVYIHTGALQEEERHRFTLARPGYRYTIVAEQRRPTPLERGLAHRALVEAFGAGEADWLDAMLDAARPMDVNRDHIVVREGDRDRDVYVVLTGELSVKISQGDGVVPVASVGPGELFGEMAAVNDAPRSATVAASTPARVLRIPGEVFATFAAEAQLLPRLPELWRKRRALEGLGVLTGASVTVKNRMAAAGTMRSIEPGSTLIREGSRSNTVFVLVAGRVQIYKGTDPLLVNSAPIILEPGSLIGETAPFLRKARNASIVTLDACEVLAIRGQDFKRIVEQSPQLFCEISQIVRSRAA